MTELTLRFSCHMADIHYFATTMKEFHNWDFQMRVIGGVVMTTESNVMEAMQTLIDDGFDLDNDFESIEIKVN